MSLLNDVDYILVYRNTTENHDKIWGILQEQDGIMYVFWGKWQQAMQFKHHGEGPHYVVQGTPRWNLEPHEPRWFVHVTPKAFVIRDQKLHKGYVPVEVEDVTSQWPEFEQLLWERLAAFKLMQLAQQCI
jgi:hypothetical protein